MPITRVWFIVVVTSGRLWAGIEGQPNGSGTLLKYLVSKIIHFILITSINLNFNHLTSNCEVYFIITATLISPEMKYFLPINSVIWRIQSIWQKVCTITRFLIKSLNTSIWITTWCPFVCVRIAVSRRKAPASRKSFTLGRRRGGEAETWKFNDILILNNFQHYSPILPLPLDGRPRRDHLTRQNNLVKVLKRRPTTFHCKILQLQ